MKTYSIEIWHESIYGNRHDNSFVECVEESQTQPTPDECAALALAHLQSRENLTAVVVSVWSHDENQHFREGTLLDIGGSYPQTGTKQSALKKLIDAGYDAELTANGIEVRGENWRVHYADRGQDFNEYHGDVPSEVEELAVWDDATTRTEKA